MSLSKKTGSFFQGYYCPILKELKNLKKRDSSMKIAFKWTEIDEKKCFYIVFVCNRILHGYI